MAILSSELDSPERQSLIQHLTDLRTCIIRSCITLGISMLGCLYFSKQIFRFLQLPLLRVMPQGTTFIATSPLEGLITYLKVALLAGVFAASPVILYQIWHFVGPALYKNEKKAAFLFVLFSSLFFIGGAWFGYAIIFPVGFKFFVTAFEGTGITFLPQMQDYLGFISKMLLVFGAIFELPVILILLARFGIVTSKMLNKSQRYVLVAIFLVAGVLTPGPDVLSQFLLAIPLLLLFELSVVAVWLMQKKNKKPSDEKGETK